jgi:hypothetical protein
LAIDVAEAGQDINLSELLADKAILESLLYSNVQAAKLIIEKYPRIQVESLNNLNIMS